jgi:hypothetical protein
MKPTFNQTVNILVQAYLNNTLVHGNCYACAVGNIIASKMNYSFVKCKDDPNRKVVWETTGGYYDTTAPMWYTYISMNQPDNMPKQVIDQIKSTGYSFYEIQRIEWAFERCKRSASEDEYMFNGLMAVVDVLADIHSVDLTTRNEAKLLFAKP